MSRERVTERYVARLARSLSGRDKAVVETLDRLRLATGKQIERIHFTDGTPAANARQAQRRLRALTEQRVVTVLERSIGGSAGGSSTAVYALDTAGQRLASACGPAGGSRLRRPWTPGWLFTQHTLQVSELYVRSVEADCAGHVELRVFDAEPGCWRVFTGAGGARSTLKPDAFVRLTRRDWEFASFVEVDRATASIPTLVRKFRVYRRYFQSGREQERLGMFPRVVVLVPSEARKRAVVDALAAQPGDTWDLFRVVPFDEALAAIAEGVT